MGRERDIELARALAEERRRQKYRRLDYFKPYPKQSEFFAMGSEKRTRLFSAAPQLGKSDAGAFEAACHMTGLYPKWWDGKRFDKPTNGVIGGVTGQTVRDICQTKLFGRPGVEDMFGTGFLPKECISRKNVTLAHGYANLYDTATIKHVSGGMSSVMFKTYEQGREKWQGVTADWGWMDEESDLDLYMEMLDRLRATNGILWTTYTPKKGKTALTNILRTETAHNGVVTMSIYDCPHLTPDRIKEIEETTPEWLKPANIWGMPGAGTGLVFEVADSTIMEDAFEAPGYWPKLWGIDFGGSGASKDNAHPFAAVLIARDLEADCIHVLTCIRLRKSEPMQHAKAMLPFGADIPVAWPHDGNRGVPGYGKPMADLYKAEGLKMLPKHAHWPDGSIATEPGIAEMDQRMKTNRLKVAKHLLEWFEEKSGYCREDHEIVKINDDLMSATRVAVMAKRFAKVSGTGSFTYQQSAKPRIAHGVERDHWGI